MIRINGRGVVYGEVWYDEEPPRDPGVDIVLYRHRDAPIAEGPSTPFLSMVTDLSVAEDAITEKFGKNCLYKIKRAEARDGLRMEFHSIHRPLEEYTDALHAATKPQAERYIRLYISALVDEITTSVEEHNVIIRRIADGDAVGAQQAVDTNWRNAAVRLAKVIASLGERGSW